MVGTTSTVKLKASADTVSELIGDVKSLPAWQPAVAESRVEDREPGAPPVHGRRQHHRANASVEI